MMSVRWPSIVVMLFTHLFPFFCAIFFLLGNKGHSNYLSLQTMGSKRMTKEEQGQRWSDLVSSRVEDAIQILQLTLFAHAPIGFLDQTIFMNVNAKHENRYFILWCIRYVTEFYEKKRSKFSCLGLHICMKMSHAIKMRENPFGDESLLAVHVSTEANWSTQIVPSWAVDFYENFMQFIFILRLCRMEKKTAFQ